MKILDGIARFGEACNKITFSHSHNLSEKICHADKEKPVFVWHTEGNFSVKILKLAASTAIVAGGYAIADHLKTAKKQDSSKR